MIGTQDMQIFPGMFFSVPDRPPPAGTESIFTKTEDVETLEIWRKPGAAGQALSGYTAIFVHGNVENVYSCQWIQEWLARQGATAYTFDFRGYGHSTGWP